VWKTDFVAQVWFYVLILSIVYFCISAIRLKVSLNSRGKNTDVQVNS
jgi:putative amide transporter protein